MSEEAAVAAEQNDVTFGNRVARYALKHQRIAGPNRRQHAPTGNLQTQFSGRTQYFARQFAFDGMSIASACGEDFMMRWGD